MKLLQSVSGDIQGAIEAQFPKLQKVRENEPNSMNRFAISIFDHWLRDESEWYFMDCFEGEERAARDKKFVSHWELIFKSTDVFTVRYRGRWPRKSKLIIKKYLNEAGFLKQCWFYPKKSPKQFVILPEFDSILVASWDDTNIVYFNSRSRAEPIINMAKKCGLYCLEMDVQPSI